MNRVFASLLTTGVSALVIASASCQLADAKPVTPNSVKSYQAGVKTLNTSSPLALERVYNRGLLAADAVTPKLSQYDAASLNSLKAMMKGFVVTSGNIVPDGKFFLAQAKKHNVKQDTRFFTLYTQTKPDNVFPVYLKKQSADSGCVNIDGTMLSSLYKSWKSYQASYPQSYKQPVTQILSDMDRAVMSDNCYCQTQEEALSNLETFAKSTTKFPISKKVSQRVSALRKNAGKVQFECIVQPTQPE